MKQGYHSIQKKYYNAIPRSVFLGLALGYAAGMFVTGFLHMDSYVLEIAGAVIGCSVGCWIDRRFYLEKDDPDENQLS